MYILGSIYQFFYVKWGYRYINFGIVKMGFVALDKTIVYFLIYLIFRTIYNFFGRKKSITFKRELIFDFLVFYFLFILFFTVFRKSYWPWQIRFDFHRSLKDINWIPFVQTLKMTNGITKVALVYNFLGNILLFIPIGFLMCSIRKTPHHKILTFFSGFFLSVSIEAAQFIFHSGQSDIDDIIFNTVGILLGLGIYHLLVESKKKSGKRKNK